MSRSAAVGSAWLFPGQGAQHVGMGRDLYEAYPSAREIFDRADHALQQPLSAIIFHGPEELLLQTIHAQPAIFVTSLACLAVAKQESPLLQEPPAFVAGHSLGEYSALVAADALALEDGIRLVQERGRLMHEAGQRNPGAMAAVLGLAEEDVEAVCRETGAEICNINSPQQIVIGGTRSAVARAMDLAKARGARRCLSLRVSGAFHSSLMRPAADAMRPSLEQVPLKPPIVPLVANVSGEAVQSVEAVRRELTQQVCQTVRWRQSVEYMVAQGVRRFIEIGPGTVLTSLMQSITKAIQPVLINLNDADSIRTGR